MDVGSRVCIVRLPIAGVCCLARLVLVVLRLVGTVFTAAGGLLTVILTF